MRKYVTLLLLLVFTLGTASAAYGPGQPPRKTPPALAGQALLMLKPAQVQALTGKKLTRLQKIKLSIYQKGFKKYNSYSEQITEKQKKQGKWSMILGIGSIVLLLIPYVGLLAIPAAITGLVLGIKSVKGNANTQGVIGIVTSGATLLLLFVGILLLAALFSNWN